MNLPASRYALRSATAWLTIAILSLLCVSLLLGSWKFKTTLPVPSRGAVAAEQRPLEFLNMLSDTTPALTTIKRRLLESPQSSSNATLWIQLGDILAQEQRNTGRHEASSRALDAYRFATMFDANSPAAMSGLAWAYGARHEFATSIDWAKRALAANPHHPASHGIIGDAAVELGDYDLAFQHYQKMMDLRPDLSSWSRGSHLLWLTGSRQRAVVLMEQAIRAGAPFEENTAWCRAKLAMMLFHSGAFVAAEQVLAPALKATPPHPHVLLAAGHIAAAKQDFPAATAAFRGVLSAGPQHEAWVALGDLSAAQGEVQEAEKFYSHAEDLYAKHVEAGGHSHLYMAKFWADHDRKLVDALKLTAGSFRTRNVLEADILAWVFYKNHDLPHAASSMKLALSQGTPSPEIHFHAGMIAAAAGDRLSAVRHLQEALSLNPSFHILHAQLARRKLEELGTGVRAAIPVTQGPDDGELAH